LKKLAILFCLFFYVSSYSQVIYKTKDSLKVLDKFTFAKSKELFNKPIGKIIEQIGMSFVGTDYVAHTLEIPGEEKLVINLYELDCTTFLETTFALSSCIKEQKFTFTNYIDKLKLIRYRDGQLTDYTSRLHYTSDWIINNEKKGLIKNITENLGGIIFDKELFIMSKNTDKYTALKDKPELINNIIEHEKRINSIKKFYIPINRISNIEKLINTGDFIGLATNIEGIDVSHVGIAIKGNDGHIYFLHAPMAGKKVEITSKPLSEYISGRKSTLGIIVFRPVDK